MILRRAKLPDLIFIQQLNQELFSHDHEFDSLLDHTWPLSKIGEKYFTEKISGKDQVCFVAEEGSQIVGYLAGSIGKPDSTRSNVVVANIDNILVLEAHRSKGVGKMLIKQFCVWCKNKATRISVTAYFENTRALGFYKNLGFEELAVTLETEIHN